ncbi:S8 family serine peptidase [Calorimonas adulescens]|nr:S8 family serine peptidase [Calorimonas adulescens]
MRYIEENLKEFTICNIIKWHELGYTGKSIKIAEIESCNTDVWFLKGKVKDPFNQKSDIINSHGQKVLDVMNQVAPDAELYILPSGIISESGKVRGAFIEKTLPYIKQEKINIIGASIGGFDIVELNKAIEDAKEYGCIFVTSAGNEDEEGLSGFAKSNVWISVGAVGWSDQTKKIQLKNYSSKGKELDIVSFSGLYVRDGRIGYEERTFQMEGTSFSSPMIVGMIALVQQYFLERTGRTLYQDEIERFMYDHVIDLGNTGWDEMYGYGLFILPNPANIDIQKYIFHRGETIIKEKKTVLMDAPAKIIDNRFYIVGRHFTEAFGGKVLWDPARPKEGIFELNGKRVTLTDGSKEMIIEDI